MAISFSIAGTCREPPNRLAPRSLVLTGAALVAAAAIRTFMQSGGPFGLAMFAVVLQGSNSARCTEGLGAAYRQASWWALARAVLCAVPAALLPGQPPQNAATP